MTFNEIWTSLVTKSGGKLNKDDTDVEFKASKLKDLLRQVYDQGVKQGEKKSPSLDMFNGLF